MRYSEKVRELHSHEYIFCQIEESGSQAGMGDFLQTADKQGADLS